MPLPRQQSLTVRTSAALEVQSLPMSRLGFRPESAGLMYLPFIHSLIHSFIHSKAGSGCRLPEVTWSRQFLTE